MKDKDTILLQEAYIQINEGSSKIVKGHSDPYGVARREYNNHPNPYKANPQNPESENEKRINVEIAPLLFRAFQNAEQVQQWIELINNNPNKAKEELYKIISSQNTESSKAENLQAVLHAI